MVLSEILNITNNLKQLNESFKSSFLKEKLLDMEYVFTHSTSRISQMGRNKYFRTEDLYDAKSVYANYYKQWGNDIDPEVFNDPVARQEFINVKYIKNTGSSFIREINKRLKEECGIQLDIANIPQESIGVIPDIEQAKKKGYKNQLQFWLDTEGKYIRAIVCNNKIICMINPVYMNKHWPMTNKDYRPNFTQEECVEICKAWVDNDSDTLLEEFLYKAFKFRTNYEFYMSPREIRSYMDTNAASITKLIDFLGKYNITIFSVDLDAMQENDITEKMELRQDYKRYMMEQRNLLYRQRERYRKMVSEIKALKEKNNTETSIILINQLCIDAMQMLYKEQVNILSNYDDQNAGLSVRYMSITLPKKILSVLSDTTILQQIMTYNYDDNRRRTGVKSVSLQVRNIFEILMTLSLILQMYMSHINDILNMYARINNATEGDDTIPQQLSSLLTQLKIFKEFHEFINRSYSNNITYIISKQNNVALNTVLVEFEKVLKFKL